MLGSWQLMAVLAVAAFGAAGWAAADAGAADVGVPTSGDGVAGLDERVVRPAPPPSDPYDLGRFAVGPAPVVLGAGQGVAPPSLAVPSAPADDPGPRASTGAADRPQADRPAAAASAGAARPDVQAPDPIAVRIPALDRDAPTIPLGIDDVGAIEVPEDPAVAGWWRAGPEPGEPGAAVLLGHVDSWRGPGVFFGLDALRAGDAVLVDRADGSTVRYVVDRAALYHQQAFPADRVYGHDGHGSVLRLVTCGGRFDPDTRSYESNYVVYAVLDAVIPAPDSTPGV